MGYKILENDFLTRKETVRKYDFLCFRFTKRKKSTQKHN